MPRFKVGELVTTRAKVKVLSPGMRRSKWLYLLPGCKWTVKAVEPREYRQPIYTITVSRFEVVRKEGRLRPVR